MIYFTPDRFNSLSEVTPQENESILRLAPHPWYIANFDDDFITVYK